LLPIFQSTHLGDGKNIEFSPHNVVIGVDVKDPSIVIASMCVDDCSRLNKFEILEQ